ncbi:Pimeloyl-ACP methyl ester carboxylesterase [Paracoccus alcaliphilus]|uniref:Palmitoyl-protein thioesterase ABHD10, mitochondrial n=2 Tax=Paracoccus alcaliphilus TaxID=34002 RepID=A0A1H8K5R7_9RHOB|nr:alpha/beta hydrolase [Paracoccus alcaliphilus]WCR17557.1 alpha/beta hydrolase [Paracoccus alcaliphilus]SEN88037.1 Pimeloyl-ACP methyl ester carboxylesterase [Paracoccus alcaliphilus]
MVDMLETAQGRSIAYRQRKGRGTGVVFLGGFRSDMTGTKAEWLDEWAQRTGRPFLRFDYSGHGASSGAFEDGCIGQWFADATAAITTLTDGPQVLVGSSMGGWISLLLSRAMPERVAGLVTIAAAPDFTEQGYWAGFDEDQRQVLLREGRIAVPSDYGDPYVITRHLIEDGRDHLIMDRELPLPFPVRMLQGTADEDVPVDWALRLLDHARGEDVRLTLMKGADHRFSTPECLELIGASIEDLSR